MYNIRKNDFGGWDAYPDPNGPFQTAHQANLAAHQASMVENIKDVNLSSPEESQRLQQIINNNTKS